MRKIRIIALDGGGIRGIVPATVMNYIETQLIAETGNPDARISDYVDLIAGTSTGGILGCFYLIPSTEANGPTTRYKANQALEFYTKHGYRIFNESKKRKWGGLRQLFDATAYSAKNLEAIFAEKFGDVKMHELTKPCIITTYNMAARSSFFFSSREDPDKRREFYVRDVARSTGAAPTYFPPARITNLADASHKMVNIDGGVFANNPSLCAYAEARTTNFGDVTWPTAKDMLLLSIGTGGGQFELKKLHKADRWGVLNWATSIPNIMMDGSLDTVHYQMQQMFQTLLGGDQHSYLRVDVPHNARHYAADMADASPKNIDALRAAGEATVEAARKPTNLHPGLDWMITQLLECGPIDNAT